MTTTAAPSCLKGSFPGTHRAVSPEQTWARIQPMLPELGITRVARVTGLDRIGIPVWVACRPNSRSLATSQGKGLTDETARVSAAMECLELHHAERPTAPLTLASAEELACEHVPTVAVSALATTTTSRFHPARPLLWVEARSWGDDREVMVPFELVHTNAVVPAPTGSGCFSSTSNGLASGNTWEEALVHALCEVIERDAAAVWQAAPASERAARRMDLGSVVDPDCRGVLDTYRRLGVEVLVHDVTSDIAVPTFLCEIQDRSGRHSTAFTGMGCHLDPDIAFLRAALEAAQSRLTYITGSRDDLLRRDYRKVLDPESAPAAVPGTRGFGEVPPAPETPTFSADLDVLTGRLARVGLAEVLTVDLTSPRFGVPVVRVVVPGLEGPDDDPTYVPGRRARIAAGVES